MKSKLIALFLVLFTLRIEAALSQTPKLRQTPTQTTTKPVNKTPTTPTLKPVTPVDDSGETNELQAIGSFPLLLEIC